MRPLIHVDITEQALVLSLRSEQSLPPVLLGTQPQNGSMELPYLREHLQTVQLCDAYMRSTCNNAQVAPSSTLSTAQHNATSKDPWFSDAKPMLQVQAQYIT